MSKEMYRYIWFLSIMLKRNNYKEEEIYFKMSELISPYFELNDINLNDFINIEKKEKILVEVNPFLRFTGIFELLLDPNFQDDIEIKNALFNIFMHINNYIDLQDGLNKKIVISRDIINEIEEGYHGENEKILFQEFSLEEKLFIAENIYELYTFEENLEVFRKVIKYMFRDSLLYDNIYSETKIVIYINYLKNSKNLNKFKFIRKVFLPLDIDTKVFWKNHFGIVGINETMKIGEIAIY